MLARFYAGMFPAVCPYTFYIHARRRRGPRTEPRCFCRWKQNDSENTCNDKTADIYNHIDVLFPFCFFNLLAQCFGVLITFQCSFQWAANQRRHWLMKVIWQLQSHWSSKQNYKLKYFIYSILSRQAQSKTSFTLLHVRLENSFARFAVSYCVTDVFAACTLPK